jgi:hypothetical protein
MILLDTLKYQDSIVGLQREVIAAQADSISQNHTHLDSLAKAITAREAEIHSAKDWFIGVFCKIPGLLHDLRVFLISREIFIFCTACTVMAAVVITIDLVAYKNLDGEDRKSSLGFKYDKRGPILAVYTFWAIGAGVVAYLATSIDMFQCTMISCVTIAITWPTVFAKILEKIATSNEPTQ